MPHTRTSKSRSSSDDTRQVRDQAAVDLTCVAASLRRICGDYRQPREGIQSDHKVLTLHHFAYLPSYTKHQRKVAR